MSKDAEEKAAGSTDVKTGANAPETGAAHPPLTPGDVLQHFKRELLSAEEREAGSPRYLYRYLGVCRHSETQEPLALYEALYPPYGLWVRPLAMFLGEVDHAKYPQVKQVWRFQKAEEGASS